MNRQRYFRRLFRSKVLITISLVFCLFATAPITIAETVKAAFTQPAAAIETCVVELEHWGELDKTTQKLVGIYPEIFNEFSKRSGINLQLNLTPYPRVVHYMLNDDGCELSISLPSKLLWDNAKIGGNIWNIKLGIISRPDNHIARYEQLRGQRVGLLRGASINARFDEDSTFIKISTVNFSSLLRMLDAKRLDAVAGDIEIINSIQKQNSSVTYRFASPMLLNELPLHVMAKRQFSHPQGFSHINQIFMNMKHDGTIRKIIHRNLSVFKEIMPKPDN
mgnify:CR=1 FL=1